MSGNPRWMYRGDGFSREPHDFAALLAELQSIGSEARAESQPARPAVVADRAGYAARGSVTGADVRVPVAAVGRLKQGMELRVKIPNAR